MVRCDDAAQAGGMASAVSQSDDADPKDGIIADLQDMIANARQSLTEKSDTLTSLAAIGGVVAATVSIADFIKDN